MQKHPYKLKPDVRKRDDPKYSDFLMERVVPLKVNVDYRNSFMPMWNQGNLGACQSFANDALVIRLHGNQFEPSHLYTYYGVREADDTVDEDSGGTLSGTIDANKINGLCSSALWPYDVAKFKDKPPEAAYAQAAGLGYKIKEAYRANSIDEIRQGFALGHLPYLGVTIFESFENPKTMQTGIIPMPKGEILGGHAIDGAACVDNDAPSCKAPSFLKSVFIKRSAGIVTIRNSWGPDVGIGGYFTATYEVLEKILQDAWIFVK